MRGSFGLTPEHATQLYEQFFLMKYHGGWSFTEAYNLPVKLRRWFLERLAAEIKKENEAQALGDSKGEKIKSEKTRLKYICKKLGGNINNNGLCIFEN